MNPERPEHLLKLVGSHMKIRQCRSREPIGHAERFTVTLRYLASGDFQQSVSFNFSVCRSAVSYIIRDITFGMPSVLFT